MQKSRALILPLFLWLTWMLWLLSGCGTLTIQVEPLPPAGGQPAAPLQPTFEVPFTATVPTATVSPSETPSPTPSADRPNVATVTAFPADRRLPAGTPLKISRVWMLNRLSGWAVATAGEQFFERIFMTQDGGETWSDRTPAAAVLDGGRQTTRTVFFAQGQNAWAVFNPLDEAPSQSPIFVWRSTDGGLTWTHGAELDLEGVPMTGRFATDLAFSDTQNGWVLAHLGAGMSHDYVAVFLTADGGMSWRRVLEPSSPYPLMACGKSGLAFTGPSTGWLAGDCPGLMSDLFFYTTPDGGQTWKEVRLPVPADRPSDYFSQSGRGCGIKGFDYFAQDTLALTLFCTNYDNYTYQSWLYLTEDNGATWKNTPLPAPFSKLDLINPQSAVLVGSLTADTAGSGGVYTTLDGGRSWTQQTSTGWTGSPNFVDVRNGWVVAENGPVTALVRTSDGGKTWEELQPVIGP